MSAVYDWYKQGMDLLRSGDAHGAAALLERAASAEPDKASIREGLARAYFGAKRFEEALAEFNAELDISPVEDYAYFGAGLCLARLGRLNEAIGQLRLACVLHPGNDDYERALERFEASLAANRGGSVGNDPGNDLRSTTDA